MAEQPGPAGGVGVSPFASWCLLGSLIFLTFVVLWMLCEDTE